jgi:hypothetical protein
MITRSPLFLNFFSFKDPCAVFEMGLTEHVVGSSLVRCRCLFMPSLLFSSRLFRGSCMSVLILNFRLTYFVHIIQNLRTGQTGELCHGI